MFLGKVCPTPRPDGRQKGSEVTIPVQPAPPRPPPGQWLSRSTELPPTAPQASPLYTDMQRASSKGRTSPLVTDFARVIVLSFSESYATGHDKSMRQVFMSPFYRQKITCPRCKALTRQRPEGRSAGSCWGPKQSQPSREMSLVIAEGLTRRVSPTPSWKHRCHSSYIVSLLV